MIEVFLQSPGIMFTLANGNRRRTPTKFTIDEKDKALYESLISFAGIDEFQFRTLTEEEIQEYNSKKKPKRNSKLPKRYTPKFGGLNFKINLQ